MPQSVDIKGVGIVSFPDEYTPDQIKTAIETDILPQFNKQPAPAAQDANPPSVLTQPAIRRGMESLPENIVRGVGRGLLQLGTGAAQLGTEGLQAIGVPVPESVTQELDRVAASVKPTAETPISNQIAAVLPEAIGIGSGIGTAGKVAQAAGLTGRTAKAATVVGAGAGTGAIAGALQPTTEGESRAGNIATYAAGGAVAGPVAQGIARGAQKFLGPKAAKQIADSESFKAKASDLYKEAEQLGGVLSPQFTDNFLANAQGLSKQTTAGQLTVGQDELSSLLARWESLRGQPISLQAAKEIDEGLSEIAEKYFKEGRITAEGRKIIEVQSAFRDAIESAVPSQVVGGKEGFLALRQARKAWQQAMKINDIERVLARAEFTDQPANSIKNGFRTLLNNPKRLRGYSKDEIKLMREAASTNVQLDTLRTIGSRLLGIGTTVTGNMPAAIAAQVAGRAARTAGENVRIAKAQKVIQEIADPGSIVTHSVPTKPVNIPVNPAVLTGAALTE
jgi:hypothetical protein